MNTNLPFVSIVVASFNREHIIQETIEALLNQSYPSDFFEVIIVDNNSQDRSVQIIKESFVDYIKSSKLKLLSLDVNSGSAGTYNKALSVINDRWSYMLKMDEDLVLDKECLSRLVEMAQKKPKAMMVGGKVYFYKDRNIFHAVGSFLRPYFAIARGIGVNQIDEGQFDNEEKFDGLNGCMILCSKELYNQVGWFDEDYFLYYDDHDLMYKSLKKGYQHWYCPAAIGYHDTSTSTNIKYSNAQWLYYSSRGSWMFFYKNFNFLSINGFIYLASNSFKVIVGLFLIFIKSPKNKILNNLGVFTFGNIHGLFKTHKRYYDIERWK